MESFMENLKTTDKMKVGIILNHLTKEAKSYIDAKPDELRDTPEKVYELLRKRFGAEANRDSVRVAFESRAQNPAEIKKYLDALESLRSQAYPNENLQEREKEIVRRFIAGLRDADLKRTMLTWQMMWDVNQNYSIEFIRSNITKYLLS